MSMNIRSKQKKRQYRTINFIVKNLDLASKKRKILPDIRERDYKLLKVIIDLK